MTIDLDQTDYATVEAAIVTSKGTMVATFFPEQAPRHVRNFLTLARQGFYDGVAFHRVARNFVVQVGCPHSKRSATGIPGTGGPGYTVPAEFSDLPHHRGVLSMARGPDVNSGGSQFFVVLADHARHLDGQYSVFGKLEEGLDVLDAIGSVDCDFGPTGERSKPKERVDILRIELRPRQQREPVGEAKDAAARDGTERGREMEQEN